MRRQTMATLLFAGYALTLATPSARGQGCPQPPANIVFEWTDLLLAVSGQGTPTTAARNQGNQVVSRSLAMMAAAIYDSVNAIDQGSSTYYVDARFLARAGDSADAAAAQAAHDVVVGLYSRFAEVTLFDATLAADLCAIPDGPAKDHGVAVGQYVAGQILAWRANDGSNAVVPYTIGTDPGDWQPTPPNFTRTPRPRTGLTSRHSPWHADPSFVPDPPPN